MDTTNAVATKVPRAEMLKAIEDYILTTRKVRIAFDIPPPQPELPMFKPNKELELLETLMNVDPADWGKYLSDLKVLEKVYEEVRLQINFLDDCIKAQSEAEIAEMRFGTWD